MGKYTWFILASVLAFSSCIYVTGKKIRGNGVIKSEDRSVSAFKNVQSGGSINIYVSQGNQSTVKIEGDENLLPYVTVTQDGDKIFIKQKDGYDLSATGELKVHITAPAFGYLEVSGSGDIKGETRIDNPDKLSLSASGSGNIEMELDAPEIEASISGSGSIKLKGQTKNAEITITGAGQASCYGLLSENTKVEITGAGSGQVFASVNLDATVSGVGNVSYKGNPAKVNQQVSGVGSVNKAD